MNPGLLTSKTVHSHQLCDAFMSQKSVFTQVSLAAARAENGRLKNEVKNQRAGPSSINN